MNNMIYIADNDFTVRQIMQACLEKEGYTVVCFETGDQLYDAFRQTPCQSILFLCHYSGP